MEESLRAAVPDRRTTRLVCRSGNPADPDDLERAAIAGARSIIIVRGEDGDAGVVKAVLAVRALDPDAGQRAHIVAELTEADNARIITAVTNGGCSPCRATRWSPRSPPRPASRAGSSAVFTDLLDFDGDEMYFATVPELAGHTYRRGAAGLRDVLGDRAADGRRRRRAQPTVRTPSSAPATS